MLELQIQEIEFRIISREQRIAELKRANETENGVYLDNVERPMQNLFDRIAWREQRILELIGENKFDELALLGLRF